MGYHLLGWRRIHEHMERAHCGSDHVGHADPTVGTATAATDTRTVLRDVPARTAAADAGGVVQIIREGQRFCDTYGSDPICHWRDGSR